MFEPTNEQGVIVLFAQQAQQAGIEIVEIRTQYPDAVIKKDGKDYKAEFEFEALNFRAHGHDPAECDLIICYKNDWADSPLPVIELGNPEWSQNIPDFKKDIRDLMEYWKNRALKAEADLNGAIKRAKQAETESNGSTYFCGKCGKEFDNYNGLNAHSRWCKAKDNGELNKPTNEQTQASTNGKVSESEAIR